MAYVDYATRQGEAEMDLAVVLVGDRRNWNSLGALAGALEVDPRLQDLAVSFVSPGQPVIAHLRALASRFARVVAGFSFTTPDLPRVAGEIANLRRALPESDWPGITLVAGGPHATASWRSTLAIGCDGAVMGEGAAAFPELVWRLASGGRAQAVPGVAWPGGHNGRARPVSLDDYPPFSARYRHLGPIEISRGCPHRCSFCATPFLTGRRPRHRRLVDVLRYVETCLAHGLDQVRFIAPNSFAYGSADGRPRVDLLEALLRPASELAGRANTFLGSFPSEVRPDSVTPAAVELVARYCGNDNLVIGAQSGSQRMLERMARGHSVADIRRAVAITQAAGLRANVDIIFGLPGETAHDRAETRRLVEELAARGARIHSHTFLPLPGSPWANQPPGTVDEATARWLGALAGQGRQYGSWQKQAAQAQRTAEFMAQLRANRS